MADVLLTPAVITSLYRSHGDQVWRRARAILRNDDDARDLVQEVFLWLWTNPGAFRGQSAPSTYLYAATTRAALTRLRDARNRARLLDERVVAADVHPTHAGLSVDQRADLRALMARLPEHVAEVVVYSFIDGMSHDEIAALLGITRREVAARLERIPDLARHLQSREVA